MRYCPVPSLTTVRVFSMSAGLDASTVTPGRTAADASRTTPAIVAWANDKTGQQQDSCSCCHDVHDSVHLTNLLEPSPASGRGLWAIFDGVPMNTKVGCREAITRAVNCGSDCPGCMQDGKAEPPEFKRESKERGAHPGGSRPRCARPRRAGQDPFQESGIRVLRAVLEMRRENETGSPTAAPERDSVR